MARPISVPPSLHRSIGSRVEEAGTSPYLQPLRLQTPSIPQLPLEPTTGQGDKEGNSEEPLLQLGDPSPHETELAIAGDDDISYDTPRWITTSCIPGARSGAHPTSSRPVVEAVGMNPVQGRRVDLVDGIETTVPSTKPTAQMSRSTRCGTAYQDAQSQARNGDILELALSGDFSCRALDVVDVWEKSRQELWKTVDSTKLDDAALGTLVWNYQETLEKALGQLVS